MLQRLLADFWPLVLALPALSAVVIACFPEGIRCGVQAGSFWLTWDRAVAM